MAAASSSVSRSWDSILGADTPDSPRAASPSASPSPSPSAAAAEAAALLDRLCPWTSVEFGYPGSLNYRSLLLDFHGQLVSPWHHVPLHAKNGALHFVCKTPQDCWVKYEAAPDEDYSPIRVQRAPSASAASPAAAAAADSSSSAPAPAEPQQGPPLGSSAREEQGGLQRPEGTKGRGAVDWARLLPQHYAENSIFNVGFLPQTYADPEQPVGADVTGGICAGGGGDSTTGGGGGGGSVWEGLVNDGRPIEAIEIGGKRMRTGEVCSVRPLAVFAVAGPPRCAEGEAGGGGTRVGGGDGEGEREGGGGAEECADGRRTLSWIVVVVSTEDALAGVIQEGAAGIPPVLLPMLEQLLEWVRFAPCVHPDDDEAEFPLGEEPGGMEAAMVVVAQAHCAWQLLADDCPPPPPWVPADRLLSASTLHQIWQSRGYLPPAPPRPGFSASASAATASFAFSSASASGSPQLLFPTSSSAPLPPAPPSFPSSASSASSPSASACASRPAPLPPNLSMPALPLAHSPSCSSPSASPLHASNPSPDSAYPLPPVSPSFPSLPPFSASSPSASPPSALPPFGAIPLSDQRVGSSRRNETWARASIDSLAFSSLSLSIDSSFLSSGFGSGGAGSSSAGHSSNGSIGGSSSCDGDVGGGGSGGGGGARSRAEEALGKGMFRGGLGAGGGVGGRSGGGSAPRGLPRPASSDNLKRFSSAPAERERGEGKPRDWRRAHTVGAGKRTGGKGLGQGEGKKQQSGAAAAAARAAAAAAGGAGAGGAGGAGGSREESRFGAEGELEEGGSGEFQFDVVQIPGCGFNLLRQAAGGLGAELGAPMEGGGAIGGSFRGSGRFERRAHKGGGGGSSSSSSGSSFSKGGVGSSSARSSSSGRHGGSGGGGGGMGGSSSGRKAYWGGDLLKGSIPVRAGFGSARRAAVDTGTGEIGGGEGVGREGSAASVHLLSSSRQGGPFSSPERSGFPTAGAANWAIRSAEFPLELPSNNSTTAAAASDAAAAPVGGSGVAVAAAAAAGTGAAAAAATARSGSAPPSRLESFFSLRGPSLQAHAQHQQNALLLPRGAPSLERLFGHRKGKGSSSSSGSGSGSAGGGDRSDGRGGGGPEGYAEEDGALRGGWMGRSEREERGEREESTEEEAGMFNRQLSLDQVYLRRKKRAERRQRGGSNSTSDAPPLSPRAISGLGWVLGGGKSSSSSYSSYSSYSTGGGTGGGGGKVRGDDSTVGLQVGSKEDPTLLSSRLSPALLSSPPSAGTDRPWGSVEGSAAYGASPAISGLSCAPLSSGTGSSVGGSGGGSSMGMQGRWCDIMEEYGGRSTAGTAGTTSRNAAMGAPAEPALPPLPPRAPSLTRQGLGGRSGERGGERADRGGQGEGEGEELVEEGQKQGAAAPATGPGLSGNTVGSSGSSSTDRAASSCFSGLEEEGCQADESVAAAAAAASASAATSVASEAELQGAESAPVAGLVKSPSRGGRRQVSFHSVVKVIEFVQVGEGNDGSSSGSE
ncbi:hypothetical protein CLOM_g23443 [Closterium sp. NIES-68]|nr:hypothetical protein CLOM_g23443 [Closterium sp. NIES-68]GJP72076.1 hypothetical protein CLOP_g2845 [Closterium sp. NIES-67]